MSKQKQIDKKKLTFKLSFFLWMEGGTPLFGLNGYGAAKQDVLFIVLSLKQGIQFYSVVLNRMSFWTGIL